VSEDRRVAKLILAKEDLLAVSRALRISKEEAASEEVRGELNALVEQCRTALRDRAEEND
jgi:hypothetical protein